MLDSIGSWQIWLIVGTVFLIAELMLPSFFMACFAFGAVGASLVASLGAGLYWQLAVFALGSLLSLWLLRPVLQRMGRRREVLSGVDALKGYRLRLEEEIPSTSLYGEVKISGDVWRARSADGVSLEAKAMVEVVGREGLVLLLREVAQPEVPLEDMREA